MKAGICFLTFCLFFTQFMWAQQVNTDRTVLAKHIENYQAEKTKEGNRKVKMQFSYNPVKLVLYVPLFLYQAFISEQLSSICEFEPSCSNFSIQSIKQLGLIKGLFLTADRLTRCNGEAQPEAQYYLIDHHSGKVIDEPGMYKAKTKD